jgi:hypothetical protein
VGLPREQVNLDDATAARGPVLAHLDAQDTTSYCQLCSTWFLLFVHVPTCYQTSVCRAWPTGCARSSGPKALADERGGWLTRLAAGVPGAIATAASRRPIGRARTCGVAAVGPVAISSTAVHRSRGFAAENADERLSRPDASRLHARNASHPTTKLERSRLPSRFEATVRHYAPIRPRAEGQQAAVLPIGALSICNRSSHPVDTGIRHRPTVTRTEETAGASSLGPSNDRRNRPSPQRFACVYKGSAPRGPITFHLGKCGVQLHFKCPTIVSGNKQLPIHPPTVTVMRRLLAGA